MAKRLKEYHASTLSEMMAAKNIWKLSANSINEPIIGLNNDMEIPFINDEALNVINLKKRRRINDLHREFRCATTYLRRLIRELMEIGNKNKKGQKKRKNH